jgi:hypothetical protein
VSVKAEENEEEFLAVYRLRREDALYRVAGTSPGDLRNQRSSDLLQDRGTGPVSVPLLPEGNLTDALLETLS